MSCLDDETVAGCVEDRLTEAERQSALAHADECERCCRLLALTARALVPDDGERRRTRGDQVGRYQILQRIGGGAMGEVFAASDPQLGRRVALKVLRTDLTEPVATAQRARLLLEAQALARVAHPNVVSVYEVGVADGHIFIAMELVDGGTLAGWLAGERRSWRELLDVMMAAGRGLGAVHAAGLVHRDFKPDNVLIGGDGRVRVTDFGLARISHHGDEPPGAPDGEPESVRITRAGSLLGTPAYMAPEQLRGEPATAASDQFGFCVALYEALNRIRPFAGGSIDELLQAQQRRPLRSPSPARVPRFVRDAIQRGLEVDPSARHPSMEALLDVLSAGLRRPARLVRAALLVSVAAALLLAARPWWQHAAACPRIDATWSEARRSQLGAAFVATKHPSAPFTWRAVERALDRFTGAWQKRQDELCASAERAPAAAACLDDLRVELTALLDSYQKPDAITVEHALGAAESLTPVAQCRGPRQHPGVPREKRAPLEKELAELKAADAGAHYRDALPRAAAAIEAARKLGDRQLEARALFLRGMLLTDSGDAGAAEPVLFESFTAASEAGADALAAQAGIQEMFALGVRLSRADEARRWVELTRALVKRVGDDDLAATFDDSEAVLLTEWGRYDAAVAGMERALAAHRRLLGEQSYAVLRDLHNLGWALLEREDVDRAAEMDQKALDLAIQLFGPTHPVVAAHYGALGAVATRRGRYQEARELLEKSLAMRRATLPPDHPDLAEALGGLANVLVSLGALPEALADLNEAIAIDEKRLGPENQQMAMWIYTRGDVLKDSHQLDEAMADYQRALKMLERGPNQELVAIPLIGIGEVELARGRPAAALAPLERSVKIFDVQPRTNVLGLATARCDLGKALWGAGERARGRKLVLAGRADFASAGLGPEDESVKDAEIWLHAHPQ